MDFASCIRKYFLLRTLWQFFAFFAYGLIIVFISSCNATDSELQSNLVLNPDYSLTNSTAIDSERFNDLLLAELYNQLGYVALSAKHYQHIVSDSDDKAIVKRATVLAAISGQKKEALAAVRQWVDLSPNSIEARQYYSLLLLRNENYSESVGQLQYIRHSIEKEAGEEDQTIYSKGLKFIGSMLNIESHHDQALAAYQQYIKTYGTDKYAIQQNLILSSLAMNAEKYNKVLLALNSIDDNELVESSKIVLMRVKALKKLNKKSEAVQALKYFVDQYEVSDSIKLQLVRLMISNHQKKQAAPYLRSLVKNHPDNNDLLKSLIALEIDQAQLKRAKSNLKKLKESKEYVSDVAYFMGEISEAEGDLESALQNYEKVVDGNLQKRALKRILKLSESLEIRKTNYKLNQ